MTPVRVASQVDSIQVITNVPGTTVIHVITLVPGTNGIYVITVVPGTTVICGITVVPGTGGGRRNMTASYGGGSRRRSLSGIRALLGGARLG